MKMNPIRPFTKNGVPQVVKLFQKVFFNNGQAAPSSSKLDAYFEEMFFQKSKHATLGRWYSTARVSKRLTYETAACLRARYCTNLTCSDLNKCQNNLVNALISLFVA